ncbi:unnamed protein product, partial [Iphiclides podalirius]
MSGRRINYASGLIAWLSKLRGVRQWPICRGALSHGGATVLTAVGGHQPHHTCRITTSQYQETIGWLSQTASHSPEHYHTSFHEKNLRSTRTRYRRAIESKSRRPRHRYQGVSAAGGYATERAHSHFREREAGASFALLMPSAPLAIYERLDHDL